MDCHLFRLLMQRYHDGELEPAERAAFEHHRSGCGECRALDARFALLVGALDAAPRFEPSAGFDARVLACVDIAAYRVSPVRRAFRAAERRWSAAPVALRNAAVIAALCALFIAVYKPLLDSMIATIRQGTEALWSGIVIFQQIGHRVETIWRSAGTVRNYEIVGQMLLRAFRRFGAGAGATEIALAIASLVVVALVLYLMRAAARRKGETHVCIL
jgi:anti-sigma factor RsiW